ncbi:MAG: hypothetical protein HY822_09045 [Acidobacteria bacterium]|nr:hypothetical protein [Acidobacteriota bacterium]
MAERDRNARKRGRERGSGMVESALILLTFVSMVLFILDMSRILLFEQYFAERVRSGARAAAVNAYDTAAIKNFVCYNSRSAPGGNTSTPGLFGLTPAYVTVQRLGTAGKWDDRIRVTIQNYPVTTMMPYFTGSMRLPRVTATFPVASLGAAN